MVYKINLRFRRFSSRTGHLTGLIEYYIAPRPKDARRASRELWIENFGGSWSRAVERKGPCLYVCTDGSRRACGVGACACIVQTLSELRETSGPRIDKIPLARPTPLARQYRKLKKLIFLAPSKSLIDLFGPVAN